MEELKAAVLLALSFGLLYGSMQKKKPNKKYLKKNKSHNSH